MSFSGRKDLFDVVIPTKNAARTFSSCLNGLLRSDVPINRIIVVDNSTDETPELAQKFGCEVIYYDGNCAQHRRVGAKRAKTDYIVMIDSDIIINKDFYSKLKSYLGKFFVVKGFHRHQLGWKELSDWLFYSSFSIIFGLGVAFVHRRTFLELTKSWEDGYIDAGEDVWLYRLCERLKIPVFQNSNVVSIHLTGDFRRLFRQARWYGKSARKSGLRNLKYFVNSFLRSPFAGFRSVCRYKSLRLLPFLVTVRLYRLWGYAFG